MMRFELESEAVGEYTPTPSITLSDEDARTFIAFLRHLKGSHHVNYIQNKKWHCIEIDVQPDESFHADPEDIRWGRGDGAKK